MVSLSFELTPLWPERGRRRKTDSSVDLLDLLFDLDGLDAYLGRSQVVVQVVERLMAGYRGREVESVRRVSDLFDAA